MEYTMGNTYRLKEGAEPAYGHAAYGTNNLDIIAVDTDDKTFRVCPSGFSVDSAAFYAHWDDVEDDD